MALAPILIEQVVGSQQTNQTKTPNAKILGLSIQILKLEAMKFHHLINIEELHIHNQSFNKKLQSDLCNAYISNKTYIDNSVFYCLMVW